MLQRLLAWRRQPTPGGDATPRHLAQYNTRDARDLFSQLLRRVRDGEQIVIAHAGRPVAKLVPYTGEPRYLGIERRRMLVEDVLVLEPRRLRGGSTPTRWWRAAWRSRRGRRG